ncbi:rho guanine nucleotide exchange factor 17 isoform X3 [Neodiprion pinetum]|uniref:Rho guanine nucleotide exchange factor 17 isoform X3 n=1 Tax=Neodiprion lecontei TaxID=441921 RepID=A0A6J0B9M3_NEOLC|nr:rho guanine nucleotide exchange factor 17 isoform X3 [Neodiprion lecontei]XP_046433384.1 rho guanine nucleotide exchange factor 17 isoform X3 [Neodiprion fabricii]XP_046490124.1 rho guanine nucleotide exchange factor 17 isoform X3 [Neodiprion pinetum]
MPRGAGEGGERASSGGGFGGWLGGAARAMTGGAGGGYVVLGGTRYGLRLSQVTKPCRQESIPAASGRDQESSQDRRKKRNSREAAGDSNSRERLTDKPAGGVAGDNKPGLDLASSVADCCCIGPRSRLPLPRVSSSSTGATLGVGGVGGGSSIGISNGPPTLQRQAEPPATAGQLPPNFLANNKQGGGFQPASHGSAATSLPASVVHSVSVPRQLAQWTKHQTLKLQEPAVTAVDRLHRFRWSGGGGGSGKKSSSSPRSDKAERLRELTEKLKVPAPVPPPRRPSRLHASSPPPQQQQIQNCGSCEERPTGLRSYTYSEGSGSNNSSSSGNQSRTLPRSESVSEECVSGGDPVLQSNGTETGNGTGSVRRKQGRGKPPLRHEERIDSAVDEGRVVSSEGGNSDARHLRQYSDSVVDSARSLAELCDTLPNAASARGSDPEARDAVTRLEPRGPLLSFHRSGAPYRSASFGQVDFNHGSRLRVQPHSKSERDEGRDVRASTLPRRRGEASPTPGSASQSPSRQSPRASTTSVDSAVGSAEGLGNQGQEEVRPRSDGSDSLATSSALTSPEPPVPESHEPRVDLVQPDLPAPECLPDNSDVLETAVEEVVHRDSKIEPHEVIVTPPPEEPRLSQASEGSEAPSETPSEASSPGKPRRYRGDTSKRRKGVYITQWPEPSDADRNKLAAQSSEERDDVPATPSDLSDCEGQTPRRYSKRPLRGPYGQMLEAEMAKPRTPDIGLMDGGLRPRRKVSANLSYSAGTNSGSEPPTPCHHRTTSSPSKLEGLPGPSPELLAELLRGSSERVARAPTTHRNDTRTHVVVELYDTERSYVEALQILVNKYLQPLKSPENSGLVDSATVDEIFYQIPAILSHHEIFLEELRKRLESWELRQTIGDVFLDVFTKPDVLETYTLFLDNWKSAEKAIKSTCQAKPAFARFLETMEREHKGKLGLDQLLIKPVQKIPRYELLIQRLLKHTDQNHPDHELLTAAQKEVHELVVKINCTERESLEWEQQQTTLREVQALVEGLAGIVTNDRAFIRHDLVTIASNQGTRKERALFLFSDLLVITSIKRRSGTIRKPSTSSCPNSLVGLLEANKYKMLMRIALDDLEVMKAKDENLRRMAREVDHLREDCSTLTQLTELAANLHGAKQQLEEVITDLLSQTQRQLAERNAAHSQLACLELTLNTQAGIENISVMFTKPDKRASWEESFNEAKQKLALSADRRPCPEFVGPLPIRKTRAGLQFTCAAPTLANGQGPRDVWVCNSDGYVGQVCVLSLTPEPPQVTSCNGVCNARILCVAGIPACTQGSNLCVPKNNPFVSGKSGISISVQDADATGGNIQLDSSSSDDSDSDDIPCADAGSSSMGGDVSSLEGVGMEEDLNQPTMWLGTEDGCIHVYNCSDNIRIKKNKVKIQHGSSVHCIIYLDNKVFVSLANGDITVYSRDHLGGWITSDPTTISVGTVASPVTKMLPVAGKLWCGCHNTIKILNTHPLDIEHTFAASNDTSRPVSCMASYGGPGVWISIHNSAVLRLFHAGTYECLTDINIAPAVTKMLATGCDDIIRQHKAACLRVTALLACNELLWIGTSAGVLLTVPIPHIKSSTQRMSQPPTVTGIPHGHTGHVRFLTCVETTSPVKPDPRPKMDRYSLKSSKVQQTNINLGKLLVISGGDGYEDFRGPQASAELQAGREDSTNHLLLWKV